MELSVGKREGYAAIGRDIAQVVFAVAVVTPLVSSEPNSIVVPLGFVVSGVLWFFSIKIIP